MKKLTSLLLVLALVFCCAACGADEGTPSGDDKSSEGTQDSASSEGTEESDSQSGEESSSDEGQESTPADAENPSGEDGTEAQAVMTYAEYVAAPVDAAVVVEVYVQAKQAWWEDKATVYAQDEDGAYFLYEMACSEEDYEKLVPGTKIKVTGYKTVWEGEVEIIDSTFEIQEGSYVAEAEDVTALLGTEELIDHQNKFVSFKGMTVEAAGQDADGNDVAYLYKWDGSGEDGDDLYFNVSIDGNTYTFTVESYLCDKTTDVYNAVKNLKIGDKIDMEGFLYWYQGVNPHITSVTAAN